MYDRQLTLEQGAAPTTVMDSVKLFGGSVFSLLSFQYMYAQLFTDAFYRRLEILHRTPYQAEMALLSAGINQALGVDSVIHAMKASPGLQSVVACRAFLQPGADFLTQHTTDMKACLANTLKAVIDLEPVTRRQVVQAQTNGYNMLIGLLEHITNRLGIPEMESLKYTYDSGQKKLLTSQNYIFQLVEAFSGHQKTIEQRILMVAPTFSSKLSSLASAYVENRWLVAGALTAATLVSYLAYRSTTTCNDPHKASLRGSAVSNFCMSLPLLLMGYSLYALSGTPDESNLNHIVFTQLVAVSMLLTSVFAATAPYIRKGIVKAKQKKMINGALKELQSHGLKAQITVDSTEKGQPTSSVKLKIVARNGMPVSNVFVKNLLTQYKIKHPESRYQFPRVLNSTLTIDLGTLNSMTQFIIEHINRPVERVDKPTEPRHIADTVMNASGAVRRRVTRAALARNASLFPAAPDSVATTAIEHGAEFPPSFTIKQGGESYTAHLIEGAINKYVAFTLQEKNHHEREKIAAFRAAVESAPTMGTSIGMLKSADSAIEIRTTGRFGDYRCICRPENTPIPDHPDLGAVPLYVSEKIVRHSTLRKAADAKSSGRSHGLG